jgi:hypothetical protein
MQFFGHESGFLYREILHAAGSADAKGRGRKSGGEELAGSLNNMTSADERSCALLPADDVQRWTASNRWRHARSLDTVEQSSCLLSTRDPHTVQVVLWIKTKSG